MTHQSPNGGFGQAGPSCYNLESDTKDPPDLNPSESQPPGVDEEEIDLETALTTL